MAFPHKLGKLPPRIDPKTPKLCHHLSGLQLSAPAKQDWIAAGKVGYWGMMLNDQLGCCVISSKGHLVIEYTTLSGAHVTQVIPDSAILTGYEAVGGYVPGNPNTDQGCDMLTAAQYFVQHGYGGHRASAFAAVNPADLKEVYAAVNLFGATDIGIQLPLSAQGQTGPGLVWDVPPGGWQGDGLPGSWGGHNVPILAYDSVSDMFTVITWGEPQYMSLAFLQRCCDEAYTYLSPDWIAAGLAPNRFNLMQLQADLGQLTQKALPRINFAGILALVERLAQEFGPLALPWIDQYLGTLPLTPAQLAAIEATLAALLKGKSAVGRQ